MNTPAPATPLTRRPLDEHRFTTHDGVDLFYRHWPAPSGKRRGSIVLFHRGHEHSGRMAHLVDELNLPDFDVFAWDARGHGRSPGVRGFSPSFGTSVRDVQTFMDHLDAAHGVKIDEVYVIAQSVGAVLASTWVHDHAPRIRGMSLASPAFKVKLYVPFARTGIRLLTRLRGPFFVNSYVKASLLTHDPERIRSFEADPLITRPIASHILLGLHDAARRVVADAAAITVPTQLLVSGSDWVVHERPQRQFFARLSSRIKEVHDLPGFFHDTLGERDRQPAVLKIRNFIERLFATPAQPVDVRDAHQRGFTFQESKRLEARLPWWSPRAWYWGITRASLAASAPLSMGLGLGRATGFDSGSTLDYVYRNTPQGAGPIGRAIDANYLNSIGWRGIRQRKLHVEELLLQAMRHVHDQRLPIRLMDIAAGHGRYVLDAVAQSPLQPESILLRDYSDINVRDGGRLIEERGLQGIARFVRADAFDRVSLTNASPTPTVAVVSGLYELFSDNALLNRSLAGLADAMPEGACLVYTGQPWHPQLELIARALTSHRKGQAWVMRRRTQLEIDQLVATAGFRKVAQRVDEWGIFTVSLAVRTAV
jgi:alpha-beta hydrolase superfamily lysophospholipase